MNYSLRLALLLLLLFCPAAFAGTWQDFWWRKDQQAKDLLEKGRAAEAAKMFESKPWSAVANYRATQYEQAESQWQRGSDATSHYNLGNALALQGRYEEAISAYDQALRQNPGMQDAIYNRDLIKKLLKKKPKSDSKQKNKNSKPEKQKDSPKDDKKESTDSRSDKKQPEQDNKKNKEAGENKDSKKDDNSSSENKTDTKQPDQKPEQKSSPDQQQKEQDQVATQQAPSQKQTDPSKQHPVDEMDSKNKLDQDTDQWLQQIPDNPSGLLRRKIMRDHLRNQTLSRED